VPASDAAGRGLAALKEALAAEARLVALAATQVCFFFFTF